MNFSSIRLLVFVTTVALLSGCTKKEELSKVTFLLPGARESASVTSKNEVRTQSAATPSWGLPRPTTLAEARCYAVIVETPEDATSTTAKRCVAPGTREPLARVSSFAGLAEAGSKIEINVTSGSARKFHVLAFAADSAADCVITTAGALLPTSRLSPPALIASKAFDIVPGDNVVNITASFTNAIPVENCEWSSPGGLSGGSIVVVSPSNQTNSSTVSIASTLPYAAAQAYYTSNSTCSTGGSWEPYSSTRSGFVLPSGDGIKHIYAKFRDSSGATSECLSTSITLDQTAPMITLGSILPINLARVQTYVFGGMCSDNGLNLSWTFGNLSGTSLCASGTFSIGPLNMTALSDGNVNYTLTMTDLAGNSTNIPGGLLKDTVLPTIAISTPTAGQLFSALGVTNIPIIGSCSEFGSAVTLSAGTVNSATTCNGSGTFSAALNLSSLPDGAVMISVTTLDAAGNAGTANVSVQKDTVAPTATLAGVPTTIIMNSSATMTVAGTDVVAYQSLVTQTLSDCDIGTNYSAITNTAVPFTANFSGPAGVYHLCVIGHDQAGNYQMPANRTHQTVTRGPIIVSFADHVSIDSETAGIRMIPVTLSPAASVPITVEIQTQGTATTGVHYSGFNDNVANLTIPAGTTSINFPVSTMGTSITTTEKFMSLGLRGSSSKAGIQIGLSEHQLWIQDSGVAPLNITKISMGATHTCAINSQGRLFCWGNNSTGQLGNGTYIDSETPLAIDPANTYIDVSAGVGFTCAIRSDNGLYCWGNNSDGQLGLGSTTIQPSLSSVATGVTQVSAGNKSACYVNSAGMLKCWGSQTNGLLGNGLSSGNSLTPAIVTATGASKVAVGWSHACSLSQSGIVACWGNNASGQIGDGTNTMRTTPTDIFNNMTDVSAGLDYTCSLKNDGKAFCWGLGTSGQLGNLSTTNQAAPTQAISSLTFSAIRAGSNTTCGIESSTGLMKCWGYAAYGLLGDGILRSQSLNAIMPSLPGPASTLALGLNAQTACAVVSGKGFCWGSGLYGMQGTSFVTATTVKEITPDPLFIKLSLGRGGCGIINSGKLMCWGPNDINSLTLTGAVGDGTTTERNAPVYVDPTESYKYVSFGLSHTCAITTSNNLKCWGLNSSGALGTGDTVSSYTPKLIGLYEKVSVGSDSTCAIKTGGALYCWGNNNSGQVGDGTTSTRLTPVQILAGQTFQQVSVGAASSCAVTTSNDLYCWGANSQGQLADGTTVNRTSPTLVSGTWSVVSMGAQVMCAIDTSSNLRCAGRNASGELARGSLSPSYSPSLQSLGSNFTSVQVGMNIKSNGPGASVCGLQAGIAKCWGSTTFGQNAPALSPVMSQTEFDNSRSYNEIHVGELQQCGRTVTGQYVCRGSREEAQMPFGMSIMRPNLIPRIRF